MSHADSNNVLSVPENAAPIRRGVALLELRTLSVVAPTRLESLRRRLACTVQHRRAHRTFTRYLGSYRRCSICWRVWG